MWVYKQTETNLWTVGHYDGEGIWQPESDWNSTEDAAKRVNYLNGGPKQELNQWADDPTIAQDDEDY